MKRLITTGIALLIASQFVSAQFTSGRLAVLRVGTGSAALSNASTALFLDEYSYTGTAGYSLALPVSAATAISVSGSATSEGLISFSTDRNTIIVPGYNIAPGTTGVASTTSAIAPRAVLSVNSAGTAILLASTSTNFSANNIRGAAFNGTNVWATGASDGILSGNGTGTGLGTIVSSTTTNTRGVAIYAGQLFYSTGSGSARGIYRVGSGLQTTASTTSTLYIDVTSSGSPYAFSFNVDTTICYIADDRAISAGGGIQKWTRTGSTWSLAYTLATGTASTVGARGLSINWSGTNPLVYATTAEASANRIISITDAGASSTATTLATAVTNTIFRGISFTPGTNPLPVKFVSFTASHAANGTNLSWATASETNNSHFEVQRGIDGNDFETIGKVKGSGSSTKIVTYSFTDNYAPTSQTTYYRLNQVDFDGKTAYSKTVSVTNAKAKTGIETTLPNPFNNEVNITVNATEMASATVLIMNMVGQIQHTSTEQLQAGANNINVTTSQIPDGIYFVRVSFNGESFTQKIVKK